MPPSGEAPIRPYAQTKAASSDAILMSHIRASENPAPAATPLTAPTTGYGMRRKSTIAWWSTSAPRRTSAERYSPDSSSPRLNQVTSPPAENARPAPVTIRPRSGARSASQPAAVTSSPMSSGLIAFRTLGRSRVSVPMSPSTSMRMVSSSGGEGGAAAFMGFFLVGCVFVIWPAGQQANLVVQMADKPQSLSEQRKQLPDQPGVYTFKDAEGGVLYVGRAPSIRKRVASHFSGPHRGGLDFIGRVGSIDFLVTETEAEALLAEQQFIKRHRPRFNIRLRDDKSYPYIGVGLDEEFPRVYFTRERHRSGRVYFGPFSSARRVRETLDLLGKVFQYRTCDGVEPGRASGSPCLDYFIKRCGAPCVGYQSKEEYRRSIDAVVAFLSGRYRQIDRDLEHQMLEAAAEQEFEQAAAFRNRLKAVRHLLERQRISNSAVGTLDAIAVAAEGTDANAQVFQVRDGVLADRQSFYLDNQAARDEAEVAEEFVLQYYATSPAIPPQVIVARDVALDTGLTIAEALEDRRGAPVEVRHAERGDKRRIYELAQRNARLA